MIEVPVPPTEDIEVSGARRRLVTVCVPTIGRTEYVNQTLECALQQTYPNLEILILDNASPPQTQERLAAWVTEHPQIRVLRSYEHLPMFANFNRGLRAASGDYITYFHDDDRYLPGFVAANAKVLDENPGVAIVGSNCIVIGPDGRILSKRRVIRRSHIMPRREFIRHQVTSNHNLVPTPGVFYRRNALFSRPFDESLSVHFGDFVVLMRLAEVGGVGLIRDFLWLRRAHAAMTTVSAQLSREIPARVAMLQSYCAEYLERWPEDAEFIERARPGMLRSTRVGLMWGWVSTSDAMEAEACADQLARLGKAPLVASVLRRLDAVGLSRAHRRRILLPLARAVGGVFRL
jgi:glycosyltransferase involved in cell wall biosynthesis